MHTISFSLMPTLHHSLVLLFNSDTKTLNPEEISALYYSIEEDKVPRNISNHAGEGLAC
jgi:hypothetical protein